MTLGSRPVFCVDVAGSFPPLFVLDCLASLAAGSEAVRLHYVIFYNTRWYLQAN